MPRHVGLLSDENMDGLKNGCPNAAESFPIRGAVLAASTRVVHLCIRRGAESRANQQIR